MLVTAAAGGVGIAAVQLAKGAFRPVLLIICQHPNECLALGAKVIAAAGSQEKIDVAVRHGGADHGVNYTQPNWQQEVLKLTGGKGVNVIYDPVGMIKGPHAPVTVHTPVRP